MQTLAAGVWRALRTRTTGAHLIAYGGSNIQLPIWLLTALPRAVRLIAARRVDSVVTGDALMYALCRPLIAASGIPNATMIMGLDVTYDHPVYRALVRPALLKAPRLVAISAATAAAAHDIGVHPERISVVRLGVEAPQVSGVDRQAAGQALRRRHGLSRQHVILLTLGRLVRRKGVEWFVHSVFPHLPQQAVYFVAGDGPLRDELRTAVADLGVGERVTLLGSVDEEERELLLRGSDIFVQPNVHVPGDMEGFGLVVLEAAMRGTLTVASGLEGILDAVVADETGILLPPEDEEAWIDRLTRLVQDPVVVDSLATRFSTASRTLYGEEQMGEQLMAVLAHQIPSGTS